MQDEYPTPPVPDATGAHLVVSVHRRGPGIFPHKTICIALSPPDALHTELWITVEAAHQLTDDLRWATACVYRFPLMGRD